MGAHGPDLAAGSLPGHLMSSSGLPCELPTHLGTGESDALGWGEGLKGVELGRSSVPLLVCLSHLTRNCYHLARCCESGTG